MVINIFWNPHCNEIWVPLERPPWIKGRRPTKTWQVVRLVEPLCVIG